MLQLSKFGKQHQSDEQAGYGHDRRIRERNALGELNQNQDQCEQSDGELKVSQA